MSGLVVKNHIFQHGRKYHAIRKNFVPIVVPCLSSGSSSSSAAPPPTTSSSQDSTREESTQRPVKRRSRRNRRSARGDSEQSLELIESDSSARRLEWLPEFSENWVEREDSIPEAASPREPSIPEPRPKVEPGKHNVLTHFPQDGKCKVCKRTKFTRAPCRKRPSNSILRAQNVGDLITADHKVLSEEGEYRNNHRYAVIVQDLATQWIQSYPCKTKTSQETEKSH